ncbi:MAG: histidinol-phosphate transaminase [Acidobacteriota bacterium]
MIWTKVSRRDFARAMGATLGASLVAPDLARSGSSTPAAPAAPPGKDPQSGLPAGAVRLDSNENPYGPSPQALEAMDRSQAVAARYPDALEDKVQEAIAALHGTTRDQVILGCGSGEILRIAGLAFLGPGKGVVAAEPTFEAVLHHARVIRAEPIKLQLTADHRHDLPRMAAACSERTGLVYVCNPNNPTGTIVTRDEMADFFGRAPKTAMILVDEAYHHFVEDPRYASASEWIGRVPNLLVVRTFSKIYGLAGMRLGYGVGTKETIAAMRPHQIWSNANAAVLEAALASLEDPGLVPRYRRAMNGARRWLCSELEKDGRAFIPSQANFVMIDIGADVEPVIAALRARDILVGRKFPSLPNWLRVSIGTPEEMRTFLAGLRAVVPRKETRAA